VFILKYMKPRIITIIILLGAIGSLVFALGFSSYKVYDKPDPKDNGKLSTSIQMNQSGLMQEMAYDAIIRDAQNNLINKGRAAACLT
jgi:hypothetical protein